MAPKNPRPITPNATGSVPNDHENQAGSPTIPTIPTSDDVPLSEEKKVEEEALKAQIDELKKQLVAKNHELGVVQGKHKKKIDQMNGAMAKLQGQVMAKADVVAELQDQLKTKTGVVADLRRVLRAKNDEVTKWHGKVTVLQDAVTELERQLYWTGRREENLQSRLNHEIERAAKLNQLVKTLAQENNGWVDPRLALQQHATSPMSYPEATKAVTRVREALGIKHDNFRESQFDGWAKEGKDYGSRWKVTWAAFVRDILPHAL